MPLAVKNPSKRKETDMRNHEMVMSIRESQRLAELEATIARGKKRLVDMGWALGIVRDLRLYKREYRSFDKYCRAKWGCGGSWAYRLIKAAAGEGHRSVTSEQKTQVN